MKHAEPKGSRKIKRATVSCGTTSSSKINIIVEYPRERRKEERKKKKNI